MGVVTFGFDTINKNWDDILKNLEQMLYDINNEIYKLKESGFIFTFRNKNGESEERIGIEEMAFHIIHDFERITIGLHPKTNKIDLDNLNKFSIYRDTKIEYFFKICQEDNKLIYNIRMFCLDKEKEDFLDSVIDWLILSCEIDYKCYLKTIVWDDIRKEKLKEAEYKCQLCSKKGVKLHVHHNNYEHIGNENKNDLIVLCEGCHKKFHNIENN